MTNATRAYRALTYGLSAIVLVGLFAYIPLGREDAVKTFNRRGNFEIMVYQGPSPRDSLTHFVAGRLYGWAEKFYVKEPFKIENPRWAATTKGNWIGTGAFRMGVFYHTYLRGDTIIFVGM